MLDMWAISRLYPLFTITSRSETDFALFIIVNKSLEVRSLTGDGGSTSFLNSVKSNSTGKPWRKTTIWYWILLRQHFYNFLPLEVEIDRNLVLFSSSSLEESFEFHLIKAPTAETLGRLFPNRLSKNNGTTLPFKMACMKDTVKENVL